MDKLNCIIIDDNEIDRLTVISYVKKFNQIHILGAFSSTQEALPAIKQQKPDILFLDIDMPDETGLEFRKKMPEIPVCIFITAHAEHAAESFEVETLDFIVKPIRPERFSQAINRIEEFMSVRSKASLFESSLEGETITIKEGYEQTKIKLNDILYLEALKDYTLIITAKKRHCVLFSIGNLLKETHFKKFTRVHRSYAVQKQFIKTIRATELVLINDSVLPVGRSYKDNLTEI